MNRQIFNRAKPKKVKMAESEISSDVNEFKSSNSKDASCSYQSDVENSNVSLVDFKNFEQKLKFSRGRAHMNRWLK